MIKEVDGDGNTIATYGEKFTPEELAEFEEEFGKDSMNELVDHLNLYGEGQLINQDEKLQDFRRLFVRETEES